jgi:hypothetical protein
VLRMARRPTVRQQRLQLRLTDSQPQPHSKEQSRSLQREGSGAPAPYRRTRCEPGRAHREHSFREQRNQDSEFLDVKFDPTSIMDIEIIKIFSLRL